MADVKYDFYNPFVAVTIITADGERWPLWVGLTSRLSDPTFRINYEKAGLEGITALCFVSEVTVEQDLAGVPTITVVLTPPLEEGRKLLDSKLLEWPGGTLEVQMGYVINGQGISPSVFTGMLQKPEFQMSGDLSITLTGIGDGGFSAATSARHEVMPAQTRRDALISLLKGSLGKRDLQLDESEIIEFSEAYNLLREEVVLAPAGYTEWYLIQTLARQCRCWTLLRGRELILRPYQEKLVSDPVRSFYFREIPNGLMGTEADVFPILSVSSETGPDLFRSGLSRGVYQGDFSSATGKEIGGVMTDETVKTARSGHGNPRFAVDDAANVNTEGFYMAPGSPEDPMAQREAVALIDESGGKGLGIELTIETLGCPDIFPGDSIAVYGVGKRFDSTRTAAYGANYAIFGQTHRASLDGLNTTLKCYSNIAPFAEQVGITQPDAAGPVAKAPPRPSKDAPATAPGNNPLGMRITMLPRADEF